MQIFFLLKYYIVHVGSEPHLSHPTIPIIFNSQYPLAPRLWANRIIFFFVPSLYRNTKLQGSNSASSRTNLFGKDNKNSNKNSLFNSEAIKHFRYLHLRFVVGYRTLVLKTPYLNIITVGNSYFYFAYFRTFSLQ